jgi:hypothetical protein
MSAPAQELVNLRLPAYPTLSKNAPLARQGALGPTKLACHMVCLPAHAQPLQEHARNTASPARAAAHRLALRGAPVQQRAQGRPRDTARRAHFVHGRIGTEAAQAADHTDGAVQLPAPGAHIKRVRLRAGCARAQRPPDDYPTGVPRGYEVAMRSVRRHKCMPPRISHAQHRGAQLLCAHTHRSTAALPEATHPYTERAAPRVQVQARSQGRPCR